MKFMIQCQGCGFPKAIPGYEVTHRWHRECFINWAKNQKVMEFTDEEIEEMLGDDAMPEDKVITIVYPEE